MLAVKTIILLPHDSTNRFQVRDLGGVSQRETQTLPQNSYVKILTPMVMVFEMGPLGDSIHEWD